MAKTLATINGVLGLWLLVSAFLKLSATANLWNYLIVGLAVTVLGFWGAVAKES